MLIETRKTARSAARFAAVALVACASTACGAADVRVGEAIMRDSAGITIVENDRPLWRDGEGWKLESRPALSIGMLDGPEEYQLDRVTGARRLRDGRIVVANSGSSELRYYDAGGRHLLSVGRRGEGPGEFRSMSSPLRLPEDTLVVHDIGASRISYFDPEGRFVRSTRVDVGFGTSPRGAFADGALLLMASRVFMGGAERSGIVRDSVTLMRFDPRDALVDTLMRAPGQETIVMADGGSVWISLRAFGRFPTAAVGHDRFYLGSQDSYEVGGYAADGTLLRLVRKRREPVPVTADDIAEYRRNRLEAVQGNPTQVANVERQLAAMSYPPTRPAHGPIQLDLAGNLWVREERSQVRDAGHEYSVFDPDGRWLGALKLPGRFRVSEIGDDYVLGIWQDEFDVEQVQLYRIRKPGA